MIIEYHVILSNINCSVLAGFLGLGTGSGREPEHQAEAQHERSDTGQKSVSRSPAIDRIDHRAMVIGRETMAPVPSVSRMR